MSRLYRIAISLILTFIAGSVSAAVYTVPVPYSTIQEAVDSCGWSDTVVVNGGTYEGTINFSGRSGMFLLASPGTKPLFRYDGTNRFSLQSWQGNSAIILNHNYNNSTVTIDGFEITGLSAGGDTTGQLMYGRFHLLNCEFHHSKSASVRIGSGSSGANVSVINCEFHDCTSGLYMSYGGGIVRDNVIYNCHFGGGWRGPIGLDVHSSRTVFENNIIFNCGNVRNLSGTDAGTGIWSRDGTDNIYRNNLVYRNRVGVNYYSQSLRDTWINNTIVMNRGTGLEISGNGNVAVRNNILMYNGGDDLHANVSGKSGWDITYNCIDDYNANLDSTFADSVFSVAVGNIFATDPLFADTTDSINGFYLLVNSPCIDAGDPGIRDPDSSRSDIGCYGGPKAHMKAPQWLRNLGSIVQTVGAPNDNLSWPQSDAADFHSYRIYHDLTTTSMHYQPSAANQVATVTTQTLITGSYPHGADNTWYRVSVVGDSTGYLLGGGYSEADTVDPVLQKAFYFSNGTSDPSDDLLRLEFSEGINPSTVNTLNPGNDFILSGVGDLTGATVLTANPLVIQMGATGLPAAHNRSWIKINTAASNIADFYGKKAVTLNDSIQIITFNVVNLDNGNAYESIDQAADFASNGDFIMVYDDGLYTEEVSVTKTGLNIQVDSSANPYINLQSAGAYAFTVDADQVSIVGFTITGANTAGIRVQSGVSGARIVGNTCYGMVNGIQIDAGSAAADVRSNICYANSGAGIVVNGDSSLAANNIVRGNSGAGLTAAGNYVTVRNNVAWNNGGTDLSVSGTGSRVTNSITDGSISGTNANNSIVDFIDRDDVFIKADGNDFRLAQSATDQWGKGENGENIGAYEGRVVRSGLPGTHYHTINDAYAAAGADEVLTVYQGRYYESLKVLAGKGVTLQAAAGSHPELHWDEWGIYEGNRYYMLYQYDGAVFNLSDFILDQENVNVPHNRTYYSNRSARIASVRSGAIRRCVFRNSSTNADPFQNRISLQVVDENTVTVDSCAFYNCGFLTFSGCNNAGLKLVHGCLFDSSAQGLLHSNTNRVLVEGCTFNGGRFFNDGGGRNRFYNNLFIGTNIDADSDPNYDYNQPNIWRNNTIISPAGGMVVQGVGDTLVNNIIWGTGGGSSAIRVANPGGTVVAYYNLVTSTGVAGVDAHNWNLVGTDPLFADSANGDFYLLEHSPCIDGGDLRIKDPDFGRSDIGMYGGPVADTAAPAHLDSLEIKFGASWDTLSWAGTVPGDFNHYTVYGNALSPNFAPGASDVKTTISDPGTQTARVGHAPLTDNYYKVSAVDNDTYGSGYTSFDTIPPAILAATYHSQGTRDVSDDVLKLLLSEWVADMTSAEFDSSFLLYGAGSFAGSQVGSGVRVNDDTLIITGMTAMAARNRTWIGFRAGAVEDYAGNLCRAGSLLVDTRNVTIDGSGNEYATVSAALAAAAPSATVRVLDNGWYREGIHIRSDGLTVTADSGRAVTIDAGGTDTTVAVTGNNVTLNALRITGGAPDGVLGAGADLTVTNCIAHNNSGDGFELNGTGALYNSNAYRNRVGRGVLFTGAGTCVNVISSGNNRNYSLPAGMVQSANFSHGGAVADAGYTGTTGTPPLYDNTDSTSASFLILSPSSECVNAGDSLAGIVDTDIRGRTRPYIGGGIVDAWDAGAYETNYGGVWLHHFAVVRVPADTSAGAPVRITVTAYNQNSTVLTSYAQNTRLAAQSARQGSLITYTGITDNGDGTGTIPGGSFVNGVFGLDMSYTLAYDSVTVRVSNPDDSSGTSGSIMWYGASLASVTIDGATSPDTIPGCMAGVSLPAGEDIIVGVYDTYGNRIREYTGGLAFLSSDVSMTVPTGVTFTAADLGLKTLNRTQFTPETSGLQSLIAVTGARRDSVMLDVRANNTLASLAVSGMPDTVRAGDAFPSDVTVTAYDTYGNVITQFTQTVGFAENDPHASATVPGNRTYAASDSGSYTFPRGSFRLITTGVRRITVSSGVVSSVHDVYVRPGVFNYLQVRNTGGGGGSPVNDVTISTLDSIPMYAATFDQYGNFRSDTTAVWSLHTGDLLPSAGYTLPVTADYYAFHSLTINRSGRIRAHISGAPSIFDTTGLLRVEENPDYIYILTDPAGTPADSVTSYTMTTDDTVTFYSIGFNSAHTNLGPFQTSWSSTQSSGSFSHTATASELTVAPSLPGSGTLRVVWGGLPPYSTGLVTILPGAIDRIQINRASGIDEQLPDTALTADDALAAWCGAYDAKGNLISDTSVTWSVSGGLAAGDLAGANPGKSISYNGTAAPASGFLVASYGGGAFKDSIQIDLGYGAVSRVVIRDIDSTAGTEIGAFELVAGRDTTLYVTAYDGDDNFIPGVSAAWTSVQVTPLFSYTGTGAGYVFAPVGAGQGYLVATANGASDSTGLITVVSTPNWLEIMQVPSSVTAGEAFANVSVTASMDLSGTGAGPFIPLGYNTSDHDTTSVVWLVQGATTSPYGRTYTVPASEQAFPVDASNMAGTFRFVNAAPHRIRVCIVHSSGDTIAASAWSDPITVNVSGPVNIELRDRSADPYSWVDTVVTSAAGNSRVELHAGLYDSLGNFTGDMAVTWASDSALVPAVPAGPDSSLYHWFSQVAGGYITASSGGYASDRVFCNVGSGPAVRFAMSVVVDPAASPGGISGTEVRSDSLFQLRVQALDDGGNVSAGYTGGSLLWSWIEGSSSELSGALLAPDTVYSFAAGEAFIGGFLLGEVGQVALRLKDIDSVLQDTLRINIYDASAPEMDTVATRDWNGDGMIDGFYAAFSESLYTDVDSLNAWLAAGSAGPGTGDTVVLTGITCFKVVSSIDTITVDTAKLWHTGHRTEMLLYGSNTAAGPEDMVGDSYRSRAFTGDGDRLPRLQYDRTGGIRDLVFNEGLPSYVLSTDGAPPAIIQAVYNDHDPVNDVAGDLLTVKFSEPVDAASWNGLSLTPAGIFSLSSETGTAVFGGNAVASQPLNSDSPQLQVLMGDGAFGAVAADPGYDRVSMVPGVLRDLRGNTVAGNVPQLIDFPFSTSIFLSAFSTPNPLKQGGGYSGFIDPGRQGTADQGGYVKYMLGVAADIELVLFTVTGKPVVKASAQAGGNGGMQGLNVFFWNGANDKGRFVETGAYLLRITATSAEGKEDEAFMKVGVIK